MKTFLVGLKSAIQKDLVTFPNKYIEMLIKKFTFHFFNGDINNTDLFQKKDNQTFFIDKYQEEESQYNFGGDYYLICYDYKTIVINRSSLISHFFPFISQNQNASIYCFSEQIKNEMIEVSKEFHLNFCDNSLLYYRISNFSSKLTISKGKMNENLFIKIGNIWTIIRRCISGFLLAKSLNNSSIDRIDKCDELFQSKVSEINLRKEEYLSLSFYANGSSGSVDLIYLIEAEELLIMKFFYRNKEKVYKREIENYKNFHHPLCPRFYGAGKMDLQNYILIEFIQGETLEKVNVKDLTFQDKIKYIFEIMIVIENMHKNHYIYRDLTPYNIIIEQHSNTAILIDFDRMIKDDLIVLEEEITKDFTSCFKSPEILEGQKVSNKTDIYSIGMTIKYFFDEKSIQENPMIEEIINLCLQTNPEKRPNISQLIQHFYTNLFSNVTQISEIDCFKICKKIHNDVFSKFLVFLAEYENSESMFQLGLLHEKGQLNGTDMVKAIQYYQISAAKNNKKAQEKLEHCTIIDEDVLDDIKNALKKKYMQSDKQYIQDFHILGYTYNKNNSFEQNINEMIQNLKIWFIEDSKFVLNMFGYFYMDGVILNRDTEKAIHYLSLSAQQNFAAAQHNLGLIYYDKKDIDKSIHYFSLASEQNFSQAQNMLGIIYLREKKDEKKSFEYFLRAADNNHPESQYYAAEMYAKGKSTNRDMSKAIHYYTLAAEQKNIDAMYELGKIYKDGRYITGNINKAIEYLTLAANQGSLESQNLLGLIYMERRYNAYDIDKAIYYLKIAADQNFIESQYNLGFIYATEDYERKNIELAKKYLTLAAEQNFPMAKNVLGFIYLDIDFKTAIDYFSYASNANVLEAQYMLGNIYFYDKYGVKDIKKALYYYTLAAGNNHPIAQYNVAVINYKCPYIPQDIDRAIHYFTLSANQNYSMAQYYLGEIYSTPKYNRYDINKALKYLKLAANQNNVGANRTLGLLYLQLKNLNESVNYFLRASQLYDGQSLFMLGCIHDFLDRMKDKKLSIHYYTEAAKQNYSTAQLMLGKKYYIGQDVRQDIKKSIYYLELAKNRLHDACFYLGVIYSDGRYIKRDIDKAISYFKVASSFNDQYSKNNLGVLYKQYKNNKAAAITYFKEAIRQKDDLFSKFNLALIYLNEDPNDQYTEEIIKNLAITDCKTFRLPSLLLACFLTIKNLPIKQTIEKYKCENTLETVIFVHYYKNKLNLVDKARCEDMIKRVYNYDNFYSFTRHLEVLVAIEPEKNIIKEDNLNTKRKMINKYFYEGFGLDI